jgi:hypothetical protein
MKQPSARSELSETPRLLVVIAIGMAVCILDLRLDIWSLGERTGFDVLNDAAGMLFVVVGVLGLNRLKVDALYDNSMAAIAGVAMFWFLATIVEQLNPEWLAELGPVGLVLDLVALFAALAFCLLLRHLYLSLGYVGVGRSWLVTAIVLGFCFLGAQLVLALFREQAHLALPILALLAFSRFLASIVKVAVASG